MANCTNVLIFYAQSATDSTLEKLTVVTRGKIINHTSTINSTPFMSTLSTRTAIGRVFGTLNVTLTAPIAI